MLTTCTLLSKEDLDACFVQRGNEFADRIGVIGAITNRTILFKGTLEDWRRGTCLGSTSLLTLADLGLGVLDEALVEAAAYTLGPTNRQPDGILFACRLMRSSDKAADLLHTIRGLQPYGDANLYWPQVSEFRSFPACRLAYSATSLQRSWFADWSRLDDRSFGIRQGLATADNFRFLRLRWEVPPTAIGSDWITFDKGGEYSPYYNDLHLVLKWTEDGEEIRHFSKPGGRLASRPQNTDFFFRSGITYPRRTGSNACFRVLPENSAFDAQAPIVFALDENQELLLTALGVLNSRVTATMLELLIASADSVASASAARTYEVGIVGSLPLPALDQDSCAGVSKAVRKMWNNLRKLRALWDETDSLTGPGFWLVAVLTSRSLRDAIEMAVEYEEELISSSILLSFSIEEGVKQLYQVDQETLRQIEDEFGCHPVTRPSHSEHLNELPSLYSLPVDQLIDRIASQRAASRAVTKKAFMVDRRTELLCLHIDCNPKTLFAERRRQQLVPSQSSIDVASVLLSYCAGCSFGHWDIRYVPEDLPSASIDPFAPVPVVQPGRWFRTDEAAFAPDHLAGVEGGQNESGHWTQMSD